MSVWLSASLRAFPIRGGFRGRSRDLRSPPPGLSIVSVPRPGHDDLPARPRPFSAGMNSGGRPIRIDDLHKNV